MQQEIGYLVKLMGVSTEAGNKKIEKIKQENTKKIQAKEEEKTVLRQKMQTEITYLYTLFKACAVSKIESNRRFFSLQKIQAGTSKAI